MYIIPKNLDEEQMYGNIMSDEDIAPVITSHLNILLFFRKIGKRPYHLLDQ